MNIIKEKISRKLKNDFKETKYATYNEQKLLPYAIYKVLHERSFSY